MVSRDGTLFDWLICFRAQDVHRGKVMAIQIYCSNCYTSNGLDAKKGSNCGNAFGRSSSN